MFLSTVVSVLLLAMQTEPTSNKGDALLQFTFIEVNFVAAGENETTQSSAIVDDRGDGEMSEVVPTAEGAQVNTEAESEVVSGLKTYEKVALLLLALLGLSPAFLPR